MFDAMEFDDAEWLDFLNHDMPSLFPEMNKDSKSEHVESDRPILVSTQEMPPPPTRSRSIPDGLSSPTSVRFVNENVGNFGVPNPLAVTVTEPEPLQCQSPPPTETEISPATVSPAPIIPSLGEPATKKRRTSTCSIVSSSGSSTNSSDHDDDDEIEEEKRQRNRDHARRSRYKKKMTQLKLQDTLLGLKEENEQLRMVVEHLFGKNETIEDMVHEHVQRPQQKFVLDLQKPENRLLNSKTIQALRSRSKKVKLHYMKSSTSDQDEKKDGSDSQSNEETGTLKEEEEK